MKKFGYLILVVVLFASIYISCESKVEIPAEEDILPRLLTEKELEILKEERGLSLSSEKAISCAWSDGFGGSVSCDTGTCGVYRVGSQVGVGCKDGTDLNIIGLR
ncbi:MAG: hypothetical protein HC892_15635 [Saprospiraceae bacterium]|nr:hypothetical protein [Saprospiraceae bacterium]